MRGAAEIITEDLRLFERFFYRLRGMFADYAFTSSASLSAFPISIKAVTKLMIASPGITARYGFPRMMYA